MKKLIPLIICLQIMSISYGCIGIYTKMSHITEEDCEWINAYEIEDTIYFVSNLKNTDTLVVTEKILEDRFNPLYIHFIDNDFGPYHAALARYKFKIYGSKGVLDGKFRLYRDPEKESLEIISSLGNRYAYYMSSVKSSSKFHTGIVPFTIDCHNFKHCFIFDDSTSKFPDRTSEDEKDIKIYVINKRYGLIYYETYDGETFKIDIESSPKYR